MTTHTGTGTGTGTGNDTGSGGGADLPQLPFERRDLFDMPARYRALRAEGPITRVRTQAGDLAWLVTDYDETRRLLADERLGRSHPDPDRAARISNSALFGGPSGDYDTEKAAHQRMRRLLTPAFSRRRMNALREHVQAIVDELLDRMAERTPPVDMHEALSFPLPALVICELLGVPYEDRDHFRALSERAAGMADVAASALAKEELARYMRELMEVKRATPGEDVISDLVGVADSGREDLDDDTIAGMASSLLFAGHETTVARIDLGTALLLAHPDQVAALRRDPGLAPAAVEEILRAVVPSDHGLPRYARADIEVGDVTIRAGDALVLLHAAANRDERVFPDPDRFDIFRFQAPAEPHLGFGYAQHYCIGASLARVELQSVFGTLFQRFPTLALAVPADRLRRLTRRLTGGVAELPVTWE